MKRLSLFALLLLLVGGIGHLCAKGVIWLIDSPLPPPQPYGVALSPAAKLEKAPAGSRSPASLRPPRGADDPSSPHYSAPRDDTRPGGFSGSSMSVEYSEDSAGPESGGGWDWLSGPEKSASRESPKAAGENSPVVVGGMAGYGSKASGGGSSSAAASSDDSSGSSSAEGAYDSLDVGVGGVSGKPTANGYTVSTTMGARLNAIQQSTPGGFKVRLGAQGKNQ